MFVDDLKCAPQNAARPDPLAQRRRYADGMALGPELNYRIRRVGRNDRHGAG
jgi:hypothetical protein